MKMLYLPLILFTLLSFQPPGSFGGKILVFPLDGSHWINMKVLIEELHAKGHEITVIRPSDSWYISEKSPLYTSVTLPYSSGFEENFETYLFQHIYFQLLKHICFNSWKSGFRENLRPLGPTSGLKFRSGMWL